MRAHHGPKRSVVTDALMALAGLLVGGPAAGCGSGQQAQPPSTAPTVVTVPESSPSAAAPAASASSSLVEPGVDEPSAAPPAPPPAPPVATDTQQPVLPAPRPIQVKYGGPSRGAPGRS